MNWELILLAAITIIAYGILVGMKHVLIQLGKIIELLKIIQGDIVSEISEQTETNSKLDDINTKLEDIEKRIHRLE
jgi:hypothetical protein